MESCTEKQIHKMGTLFEKHFTISSEKDTHTFPEPESMFKEPQWQLDSLQTLKSNLNEVKSRLNNFNLFEWQKHTTQMNKAGSIVGHVRKFTQPELLTQAWCKFYEIACSFPLVPMDEIRREGDHFMSVHLCEAPGAFVAALNHWLKTNAPDVQWNWLASTLNPYCEENPYDRMVADDRFIRHTLKHWCFGADNTGDIMDLRNLDALVERASMSRDQRQRTLLVTADGSIDCIDVPGEQESAVAQLHLCETVACMHLLQKGGNFLLKLFTLFEHYSVCLMYLLSCIFHQVTVTKPASSKAGNSEMFVVCMNFKGRDYVAPYLNILRQHYGNVLPTKAMFNLQDIPNDFLRRIEQCSEFFKNHQCQVIRDNIRVFRAENYNDVKLKRTKRIVADKYVKDCRLSQMDPANEIVGREIIEKSNSCFMNKKLRFNSYNERKRQDLSPRERLLHTWNEVKDVDLEMEKFYTWHPLAFSATLEIQTGKLFSKIRSSRFCDTRILQMLNTIDNVMQDTRSTVCFPPAEAITQLSTEQQNDPNYEILSFEFVHNYDSHRTITQVSDRLDKLQTGQTLILLGYSLLTQLNVGLLYLLSSSFEKIIIETCDNEGYRVKLETYRRNEKIINNLQEILAASHNARKENMAVWSIVPMMILYEYEQFSIIMQLNHQMVKAYACYIVKVTKDTEM
ncbi:hypothetical protein DMN91_001169 [Ooceraea biroi]|uniref:Cap-specific mRNA (nucleoside-2'-O-)-methyltransferase 2 n=1 Tax=Ooceraea biroi TaxID=2015173 RepID=A0A3L8E3Y6_OOCBI|nr:cap-specific mRNA (nucleoside-2'-O-)-methyltransferase 2 isoform X1 [Ooceraea biroi]RLU27367.1 hypothetical protein DMN91_001169 [Ooceraea biroi]